MGEVAELAKKVMDLYKEIVTTSVRFDELQRSTDKTLTRFEHALELFTDKVVALHELHVREKATLEAQIQSLDGRLKALSEQAIHAVAREAAREIMRDVLTSGDTIVPAAAANHERRPELPVRSGGA